MGFSFFRRVVGGGGITRAKQIAERLGGRINPKEKYEEDVCIYLQGASREDGPEVPRAHYDVMDCGYARLSRIKANTTGAIICVSLAQYLELEGYFPGRARHFIRHHHCNFDREQRPKDRPVKRVGCCGGDGAIQWPHDRVKAWLEMLGLEWSYTNEYYRRERVVDFYKDLDIQIVFRPTHSRGIPAHTSPLKLSNAGSFGIPTVAYPEVAFVPEWNGDSVIYADCMHEMMRQVKRLAEDPAWYEEMSERARVKAEWYHIDRVIDLYKALDK